MQFLALNLVPRSLSGTPWCLERSYKILKYFTMAKPWCYKLGKSTPLLQVKCVIEQIHTCIAGEVCDWTDSHLYCRCSVWLDRSTPVLKVKCVIGQIYCRWSVWLDRSTPVLQVKCVIGQIHTCIAGEVCDWTDPHLYCRWSVWLDRSTPVLQVKCVIGQIHTFIAGEVCDWTDSKRGV
jgi:hypothetical protein